MVHCCAAYNCNERYRKGGVSFHSFPANQELREKWRKAVRRLNFKPTEHSKLCAKHFTPDCYETTPWSFMKRLKDGAVPTIFQFSKSEGKKGKRTSKVEQEESHTERCHDQPNEVIHGMDSSNSSCKSPNARSSSQIAKMKSTKMKDDAEDDNFSVSIKEEKILKNISLSSVSSNKMKAGSVKNDMETKKTGSESSLPVKRNRRKKIFFGDFISEDWINKGKRNAKKGLDVDGVESSCKEEDNHHHLIDFQQQNKQTVIKVCDQDSHISSESKGEKSNSSDKEIENSNSVKLRTLCNSTSSIKKTALVKQTNVLSVNTTKKRTRGGPRKVLLEDPEEVFPTMSASEIDSTSPAGSCNESDQSSSFHIAEKEVLEVDKSIHVEQNNIPSKSIIPKKTRGRVRKILLDDPNDALLVLPKLNTSRSSSDESCSESKIKDSSNSDETEICIVNNQKKQCLSENVKVSKETLQGIQLLKNVHSFVENTDAGNREEFNVNQVKECPNKTVLLLPVEVSGKMSCSIEINMENASNVQNNVNCSNVSSSHSPSEKIISVKPNSSDKLSSIMKLDLAKEEEILNQTLLPVKHNTNEKGLKVIATEEGSFTSVNSPNKHNEKGLKVIATDEGSLTSVNSPNSNSLSMSSNEKSASMSKTLKRKSYIGDFKAEDLAFPEKAAKCLNVAQNIIKEKDKRIKCLRQRERRLVKKVEELENVIFHLVEKKVNPEEASTVLIVLKDKD